MLLPMSTMMPRTCGNLYSPLYLPMPITKAEVDVMRSLQVANLQG